MFDKLTYVVFDIIFAIIVVRFYAYLFTFRFKHKICYCIPTALIVVLMSAISQYSDNNQNLNFFMTFSLLLIILLFYKSTIQGVLYALILEALMLISDALIFYSFASIWGAENFNDIRYYPVSKMAVFLLISISAYILAKKLKSIRYHDIPNSYWILLIIIPVGSIFLIYAINWSYVKSGNMLFESFVSVLFLFSIIVGSTIIYGNIVDYFNLKINNQVMASKLEAFSQKQKAIAEQSLIVRNNQHDLVNKLIPIQTAIDNGDSAGAKTRLTNILGEIGDIQDVAYTGINDIDYMLNYKEKVAHEQGVSFIVNSDIESSPQIILTDISVAIGIALDNAIEACQKDGSGKEVLIDLALQMGILSVRIENDLVGGLRVDLSGGYLSTKLDSENHGLGIGSMRSIIHKCGGDFRIEVENNKFVLLMVCGIGN